MKDISEGQKQKDSAPQPSILILGVGNILLGDEGVGVRTIEAMKDRELPDNVELLDGGTASIDILEYIKYREKVIIIDAVQGGGKPGTIYRFTPDDIQTRKPIYTSLHQVGILEALSTLKYTGGTPEDITIYGIEPESLEPSLELSPEIATIIPRVIELVLGEI
jgi:hydrogenase maturation protease